MVSWFLHLGSRFPILGLIRFDLLLVVILTGLALSERSVGSRHQTPVDNNLKLLLIYCVAVIPFVEWPGSVVRAGVPNLVKAVVFYYFTVAFVRRERDLKLLIGVFLGCQLFRVLEPLYLNLTEGYWGSGASMANWEFFERLSGAPSDVINPNGLAFVICTVLPFLYFLPGRSAWQWAVSAGLACACIYALILTGSRSGVVGLAVIAIGVLWKSDHKPILAALIAVVVIFGFPRLDSVTQDRYLSIIGLGAMNEGTAVGRREGVIDSFEVALQRPLFGFGLGTSREANANFGGTDQPAHNLYAEVAQELGFIGLLIFLRYQVSVLSSFHRCRRRFRASSVEGFLSRLIDAMQVWLWMNLVFSLASYGLSSYEWYLPAGLAVVVSRLVSIHRRRLRVAT